VKKIYKLNQKFCFENTAIGIKNYGNTCYFNSIMQNILHLPETSYYYLCVYKHST
jgi:ubiquitin C-terminal hydrolase